MSGRFAESENVHEFWENLAAGRDLIKKQTDGMSLTANASMAVL